MTRRRPRPRKFSRGMQIWSLEQLWGLIRADCWVYVRHKPYAPGWIMSRQFRSLAHDVEAGVVYMAIPNLEGR